jgi:hypothetical protein
MATETRKAIVAGIVAVAVAGAAFLYLRNRTEPAAPEAVDVAALLQALPPAVSVSADSETADWNERRALARYDTLQRSGDSMTGKWATDIRGACIANAPVTRFPDEQTWKQPVAIHRCFDGAIVLDVERND